MSACLVRAPTQSETLGDIGSTGLVRLCNATGQPELADQALRVFSVMNRSWHHRSVQAPAWPSDLTDDATPFEFSLAFEQGRPDVRMLVEAQGALPIAHDQWTAGKLLSEELAKTFGASCVDLERVSDLFEPAKHSALHFGLWHGVTFRPKGLAPDFKAYLNPFARGREHAFDVVHEALLRLGLPESAAFMTEIEKLCGARARPVYFCLDLMAGDVSRAKVYLAHDGPDSDDAERVLSHCSNLLPSDVRHWCNAIVGDGNLFTERPLLSCFSFTQRDPRPCGTIHIPARCYVENDRVLFDRILRLMDDVSGELYRAAVRALIARPLESARGFQTYVSMRRSKGLPRMTVYLAPEIYAVRG